MNTDFRKLRQELDHGNMYEAIAGFPHHLDESLDKMKSWFPQNNYNDIRNILILGMGGSAIGGDVVRVILQNECTVPIVVNRSYNIPAWVSKNTLVIASSYSGNTEETLSAFHQCLEKQSQIIVMSAGGQLTALAEARQLDLIPMSAGLQPRAAFGYSFTLLLLLMEKLRFAESNYTFLMGQSVEEISPLTAELKDDSRENKAIVAGMKLYGKIPVIYGSEDLTWVAALRFRGQLEENAKMLAFHHHIPEQNHNEIEGWSCYDPLLKNMCIIWLPDSDDHSRSLARMEVTRDLLQEKCPVQLSLSESGSHRIIRLLKLIHFIDWVSYYCALLNGVDPSPVNRISALKNRMSEIN